MADTQQESPKRDFRVAVRKFRSCRFIEAYRRAHFSPNEWFNNFQSQRRLLLVTLSLIRIPLRPEFGFVAVFGRICGIWTWIKRNLKCSLLFPWPFFPTNLCHGFTSFRFFPPGKSLFGTKVKI